MEALGVRGFPRLGPAACPGSACRRAQQQLRAGTETEGFFPGQPHREQVPWLGKQCATWAGAEPRAAGSVEAGESTAARTRGPRHATGPARLRVPRRPNLPLPGTKASPARAAWCTVLPRQLPPRATGLARGFARCVAELCAGRGAAAGPGTREGGLGCGPCLRRAGGRGKLLRAARTRLSERVWSVKSNKASRRSPGSAAACRPRPHHAPEAAHYGAARSPNCMSAMI